MTINEAHKICEDFYRLSNPNDEDRFLVTEALDYLITETKDPGYMLELGGLYYEQKQFELARKYYELAAEYDNTAALLCLGYIWYYGRTGARDYEKAFHYFDMARMRGDVNAAYKVADMYRRGLYVERDESKYREIIEDLYREFRRDSSYYLSRPYSKLPEVYLRMGELLAGDGKTKKALKLYDTSRMLIARRIRDSAFFGDRTIMKELIGRIYELRRPDPNHIGLFDLYELLRKPCLVRFCFEGEAHEVEALIEEEPRGTEALIEEDPRGAEASIEEDPRGAEAAEEYKAVVIRFDGYWYRTTDDFFEKAQIGEELLTSLYEELYDFEVAKD